MRTNIEEKFTGQKQVKALEQLTAANNTKRRLLFDAQDEVNRRREELIIEIEGKLQQRIIVQTLFTICCATQ